MHEGKRPGRRLRRKGMKVTGANFVDSLNEPRVPPATVAGALLPHRQPEPPAARVGGSLGARAAGRWGCAQTGLEAKPSGQPIRGLPPATQIPDAQMYKNSIKINHIR